ncbi:MAG: hypothetical protein R3B95_08025 [Nitrospirales bacterium]|nr:hypothetical protein [Nitrospirales bacterium]
MGNPKLHNPEWRVMDTPAMILNYGDLNTTLPYLEDVSDDALDKRYIDIINNVDYLVCDLRDVPPVEAHFVSSWWWLKVKFHTEREYSRRNRALPTIASLPPAPGLKIPYALSRPNESKFIVKYGEASWLEPMLKDGIIRINPASKYRGEVAETDTARHDDELKMHKYNSGRGARLTVLRTGQSAPINGNIQHTIGGPNYYVFCCSNEFDYRLFHAFKNDKGQSADSCLVIWDVDEFAKRLDDAVLKKLSGWHYYWGLVAYYDPYNVACNQPISPGVCKDFKYAYQREYRFVWHPLSYPGAKEFFDVNIGSLEDIAELHHYPH